MVITNRSKPILCVVGLFFLLAGIVPPILSKTRADELEDAIKKDRKTIAGTWKVVGLEIDGNPAKTEDANRLLVVNGDDGSWTLSVDGKEVSKGTSTIDPTKTPKQLDFTPSSGDTRGVIYGKYFTSQGFMDPDTIGNISFDNSATGGPNITSGLNYQQDQYVPLQQTPYVDYGIYDTAGNGNFVPYKIVNVVDNNNIMLDGGVSSGGNLSFVTSKGFGARKITITSREFRLASVGGGSVLVGPYGGPITITIGNGVDMMEPIVVQWTSFNVYITYE